MTERAIFDYNTILKLWSPDSPDVAVATRAWSNLIGTLTFQRYVTKKPQVSPDPSSSSEGAGHETTVMAIGQYHNKHVLTHFLTLLKTFLSLYF